MICVQFDSDTTTVKTDMFIFCSRWFASNGSSCVLYVVVKLQL